jgi:hypothetical protein
MENIFIVTEHILPIYLCGRNLANIRLVSFEHIAIGWGSLPPSVQPVPSINQIFNQI